MRPLAARLALVAVAVLALELAARTLASLLEARSALDLRPVRERLAEQTERIREILAHQGQSLLTLDPELGWRYRASHPAPPYRSNALGSRGTREYAPHAPPGTTRIAAFGDSFVHGNEVGDEAAWSAQLEALADQVEVLNFGVGGYGTDQALLLYRRKAPALDASLVILGFSETNYARNVNRYRRFLSSRDLPLFKPRFLADAQGGLTALAVAHPGAEGLRHVSEHPLAILDAAPHDLFYEPWVWENPLYDRSALVRLGATLAGRAWRARLMPGRLYRGGRMNPESEAFRVTVALVRRFADEVAQHGRRFLFVLFPTRDAALWTGAPASYEPLLEALGGLPTLDLATALRERFPGGEGLFAPGGHYDEVGNRAVAEAVHGWLMEDLRGAGTPTPSAP